MKIGILVAGHSPAEIMETKGDYGDMFERFLAGHGFDLEKYNVVDMEFPVNHLAADGWLITGSRHGVYEEHAFIPPLEQLIRDIYAAGQPMVGVCFGHQIIAQALGGHVEKFSGGWSVGLNEYEFDGQKVQLNAWHQDQVITPPADACVLGSSDFCKNAFLSYRDQVFTVQAHPEFDSGVIDGLITYRGAGKLPDDMLDRARATLNEPNSNQILADRIAGLFIKFRDAA